MFAPHHQVAADELVRVTRAGGTIGLLSWTPEGFIGQMFATMKPYAPPPPPGAQPPPLWGHVDHVRELFGDRVTDLDARQQTLRVDHYTSGAEFRDYFKVNYGPTIAVYKAIADSPDARGRPRRGAGRAGRPVHERRSHGLGVPPGHRPPRLTGGAKRCVIKSRGNTSRS